MERSLLQGRTVDRVKRGHATYWVRKTIGKQTTSCGHRSTHKLASYHGKWTHSTPTSSSMCRWICILDLNNPTFIWLFSYPSYHVLLAFTLLHLLISAGFPNFSILVNITFPLTSNFYNYNFFKVLSKFYLAK